MTAVGEGTRRGRAVGLVTVAVVLAVAALAPGGAAEAPPSPSLPAPPPGTITERQARPEDRYALAGGCYVVRASASSYSRRASSAGVGRSLLDGL